MNKKIITNELINNFEIYLYEEEKSGNTIEKYMRDVRFFCKWLQGRAVEKAAVIEYKKALCKSHAAKSVNSMLSSINTFFAFMNRRDLTVKPLKIQRHDMRRLCKKIRFYKGYSQRARRPDAYKKSGACVC